MVAHGERQDALRGALQAEIERSLAADPTLPNILAAISAPAIMRGMSIGAGAPPAAAFRIASITKLFTAAAALRFVERGLLPLSAPIAPLLSPGSRAALAGAGYDGDKITLYDLLTHVSGLADHAAAPAYRQRILAAPSHHWTRAEQLELAMALGPPAAAPGTRFCYSDTGYILVGEMLERAGRGTLATILRSELDFTGIGLAATWFETVEPARYPMAAQRLGDLDAAIIDASTDLYGGGGLVSTAPDLVRFLRPLLTGRLFARPETLAAALLTPNAVAEPGTALHAPLARHRRIAGRPAWCHGSFWGAEAAYFPAEDVALVVAWNQAECGPATRGGPGPDLVDRVAALILDAVDARR